MPRAKKVVSKEVPEKVVSKQQVLINRATELGVKLVGDETNEDIRILIEDAEAKAEAGLNPAGEPINPESKGSEDEEDNEPIDILLVQSVDAPIIGARFIRQYSLEIHGENYKDLAAEFCGKKPSGARGVYKPVPASLIGDLAVMFREKKDYDLHLDKQDPNAPIIDKEVRFSASEKNEAVRFGTQKFDSTVVVARPKKIRKE